MLSDETMTATTNTDPMPAATKKRKPKAKPPLLAAVHTQLGEPPTAGPLGKIERAQRRKRADVPANDDPVAELRRLVQDHKALTKKAAAIDNMWKDKKNRTTGETISSRVPEDRAHEMGAISKALRADAARLESAMTRALRDVPVYMVLLQHVYGLGPIVCSYIVALVDINKAVKISNLRRFCGLAVINGRLERPTRGVKLGYCGELRTRLFQAMYAMWKNSGKRSLCDMHEVSKRATKEAHEIAGASKKKVEDDKRALLDETQACPSCRATEFPIGKTSKYLDVWRNYKHRMANSERVQDGKIVRLMSGENGLVPVTGKGADASAKGFVNSTGWHKAADVLVEDIYTVWRAIEGLPVWPSYYAAKLGFNHGGSISVNAPKMLTVDEAIAMVGDVGARPARTPVEDIELPDEDAEP